MGKGFIHRNDCRICGSKDLVLFLDCGKIPITGEYPKKNEIGKEHIFPLRVYFCRNCKEVQLLDVVDPKLLFKNYRFLASVSNTLKTHFRNYAQEVARKYLNKNSLVVEFGSNDGVFLVPMMKLGIKAIGVEPATNIAKVARERGCNIINDFLNQKVAKKIIKEHGKADLVCGSNVYAHIDNMHEITKAIVTLLNDNGVFIFEVHYLYDLLETNQYDMIYEEHLMYHSVTALTYLMNLFGMEIFDVKRIPIHSGSIRVYAKKKGNQKYKVTTRLKEILKLEKKKDLDKEKTYLNFGKRVFKIRDKIHDFVKKQKLKGKKIVGYGASGRAVIHINFSKLQNMIDYVVDESPERIGRYISGSEIPIVSRKVFHKDNPDYVVLFAWNYEKEILRKEENYRKKGGKFVIPLPKIKII